MNRYLRSAVLASAVIAGIAAADAPLMISIDSPTNNSHVEMDNSVSGKVSDPRARVWIVVEASRQCWLQGPAAVTREGNFSITAKFGEPANKGVRFRLRAIANPSWGGTEGLIDCAYLSTTVDKTKPVQVLRK